MFPTPAERYYRYVAYCVLLGQEFLSFEAWKCEAEKIPDHLPVGWTTTNAFKGIRV